MKMNLSPAMKKALGLTALIAGGFVVVRMAFGGSGGGIFGGASSGSSDLSQLPKVPGAASFTGAITETTFGDITNPGMNYTYNGGAIALGDDTRYLDYNIDNRVGDTAVFVDYGSPTYGDVLVNMVAPPTQAYSPCCSK